MTTSVATQPNPDGREIVDSPQRGGRWRGVRWERYGTATFFVVFYLVVAGSNGWGFLSFSNIISVLSQNSHTAFAATAVTVTLIAGQFDLSVGALVGLSSTLVAVLTASQGLSLLVAVPLVILIAAAMGLLNGLLVTRVGVNAFIATLGTGTAFTGIAVLVTNGELIFTGIAPTLISAMRTEVFGLRLVVVYVAVLMVALWFVASRTVFGRRLFASGANPIAAQLAGVPVRSTTLAAFVVTALIACAGGLVMAGNFGSANPTAGPELLLPAFAAAFLGSSIVGKDRFSVLGTIVATFLLALALNGLDVLGMSAGAKPIFNGLVLVCAVALTQTLRRRSARRN
jgi:ribose transport system permease protein